MLNFFSPSFLNVPVRAATLVTSAPAEKKRPAPVNTVNMVSGCESRTRSAATMSGTRLPPKELRALGRLNWLTGGGFGVSESMVYR